jgi:hypothetical protein
MKLPMARKYEIFPLLLLVHTEKAGCTLPLNSANLGLSDSRQNYVLHLGGHEISPNEISSVFREISRNFP